MALRSGQIAGWNGGHDQDADGGHEDGSAGEAAEYPELVLGLDLEATPVVLAAVVVSILLAVAILTMGMPWPAAVIALAALAAAHVARSGAPHPSAAAALCE